MSEHHDEFPRGFLPASDPLPSLPGAVFASWNHAANSLPQWITNGVVRAKVASLPDFPTDALSGQREHEAAMRVLSFLAHAYLLTGDVLPSLPAKLAVPWVAVSELLGTPPVLNYNTFNLTNWTRLDPALPVALGNIAIAQHFLGGQDEQWFQMVHIAIEMVAARAVSVLKPMQAAAASEDGPTVLAHLTTLADTVGEMQRTLERMPEGCDPHIYYHRVRTYMFGWKDNPAFPNGLIYEGVSQTPRFLRGETGAQTATIYAFDGALGIEHGYDAFRAYLIEMRDYMPPAHRTFIVQLESGPDVRGFVGRSGNIQLRDAYNAAVTALQDFRIKHMEYAAMYIAQFAQSDIKNSTAVGTGGTPFMRYLAQHRDATRKHLLA